MRELVGWQNVLASSIVIATKPPSLLLLSDGARKAEETCDAVELLTPCPSTISLESPPELATCLRRISEKKESKMFV